MNHYEDNYDMFNMINKVSINTSEFIDPYNDYNKLITVNDIINIFKKFGCYDDINYSFKPKNLSIYINALTHKSYIKKEYYDIHMNQLSSNLKPKSNNTLELLDQSNERLEFLGDTVIKCIVSGYLYLRYPYENEGFMTRLKTKIENKSSLAHFARLFGLDDFMIISKQIEDNNGRNSDKLLEDCFESFIGALYLDLGFEICRKLLYVILETEIEYSELLYRDTNYKDQLLRFYHQNKWSHPKYIELSVDGPPHKRTFVIGVKDNRNNIVAKAKESSKQMAEQLASMMALYQYKVINEDQMIDFKME